MSRRFIAVGNDLRHTSRSCSAWEDAEHAALRADAPCVGAWARQPVLSTL